MVDSYGWTFLGFSCAGKTVVISKCSTLLVGSRSITFFEERKEASTVAALHPDMDASATLDESLCSFLSAGCEICPLITHKQVPICSLSDYF